MSGEATSGTEMTAKTGESKRGTGDRDLLASIEHLKTLLMSGKAIQNHQPVIETPVAATQAKVRVGLFDLVQQNEEAHKQQQLTAVPESQLNVDGGAVSTFGQKSSVYKIDQLQSEQQEWKQRFEAEKARRESLDKTYKALLGHRKELSTQLETVTKSRRDVEQQLKDLQRQQERRERERTQQDLQRIFAQQKDHEQAAQDQRRRDQERIEHSRWELNNLQLRYNDLQEELRKMNDENKRLNGERDRCHGLEISSLKDEVRRLVQDVESKKTELDQIRRQHKVELEQLRHTNDENMERTIQGRIDLAVQELKTKTRQEQELEKQVHAEADLKEQESSLKNEMIEQQEKIVQLTSQVNDLTQKLHASDTERNEMKKRQVQIDEEVKSAKDQMDSATTLQLQLKESQTKCAGLESKIEQLLAAQRQQEQQQSSQQNNSSKIVNDFVRRLPHQEEVEDNSEKFPLQNSLRNMNSLHRQLVETSTIIEENNELKKMLQEKDERLSELVQELNQYRTSAAATDATTAPITTHDEHNASEQAELQDLKRALQERDDKIDDLKEDLSKAQSKLAKTTDKLVGVEKGKEQEVKSLRSRIEVLEKQILDSEERLESFKHFNAKLMEDVASARESSRLLQGDLDESTAHRGQLEKEKAHTEKECERLFIELQSERRRVYDDARQSATSRSGRYTYNDAAESSSEDEVEEQDDIDRYHEDEDDDDDDDNDDFDCDDDDQPYDELSSKKRNWNCDKSNEDDGDDDEEEDDEDEEEGGEQKRQRTVEVINIGDTSDEDEDE